MRNHPLLFLYTVFKFTLVLLIAGCGGPYESSAYIPPEFRPHVATFEELTGLKGDTVPICFGQTNGTLAGEAWFKRDVMLEIVVSKPIWDKMSHDAKEVLVLHELGHLVAGLEHTETPKDPNGNPLPKSPSIMDSVVWVDFHYSGRRDIMLEEFKKQVIGDTSRHRTKAEIPYTNGKCYKVDMSGSEN